MKKNSAQPEAARSVQRGYNYVKAYEALAGLYRKKGDTEQELQVQRTIASLKKGAASNW